MKADALTALRSHKLAEKPKAAESPLIQAAVEEHEKPKLIPKLPKPKRVKELRTTSTMSLYSPDLSQLKKIRRMLEDAGVNRVSDSEAVRVALRVIPFEKDLLLAAYQNMSQEDGRKKQSSELQ